MIETQEKFSKKSIKKAVLSESLQSPVTIYPSVLGVLGAVGVLAFGVSSLTLGIVLGGAAIAVSGWLFEYFGRHQKYSLAYLEKLHLQMQQERDQKLTQIQQELNSINANEAKQQLSLFHNKFENFKSILVKKFDEKELTFNRYLGIAEQVFLAGLDNLENYYLTLKSISAVNVEQLRDRLSSLDADQDAIEIDALQKRLDIYQQQLEKVNVIKQQNEIALTELDHVTSKLANVQTKKGLADLDMDNAMEELARMARRAEEYEKR